MMTKALYSKSLCIILVSFLTPQEKVFGLGLDTSLRLYSEKNHTTPSSLSPQPLQSTDFLLNHPSFGSKLTPEIAHALDPSERTPFLDFMPSWGERLTQGQDSNEVLEIVTQLAGDLFSVRFLEKHACLNMRVAESAQMRALYIINAAIVFSHHLEHFEILAALCALDSRGAFANYVTVLALAGSVNLAIDHPAQDLEKQRQHVLAPHISSRNSFIFSTSNTRKASPYLPHALANLPELKDLRLSVEDAAFGERLLWVISRMRSLRYLHLKLEMPLNALADQVQMLNILGNELHSLLINVSSGSLGNIMSELCLAGISSRILAIIAHSISNSTLETAYERANHIKNAALELMELESFIRAQRLNQTSSLDMDQNMVAHLFSYGLRLENISILSPLLPVLMDHLSAKSSSERAASIFALWEQYSLASCSADKLLNFWATSKKMNSLKDL